jgi:hypothetical protein
MYQYQKEKPNGMGRKIHNLNIEVTSPAAYNNIPKSQYPLPDLMENITITNGTRTYRKRKFMSLMLILFQSAQPNGAAPANSNSKLTNCFLLYFREQK